MPVVIVTTNVSKDMIPDNFVTEFAQVLAQRMTKPITAISVALHAGVGMFRFGSTEPAALIEVRDIQEFDIPAKNKELMNAVTAFVVTKLDLNPQRISAVLISEEPTKIGLGIGILLSERLKK